MSDGHYQREHDRRMREAISDLLAENQALRSTLAELVEATFDLVAWNSDGENGGDALWERQDAARTKATAAKSFLDDSKGEA